MFHSAAAALSSQTDVEDNDTALRLKTSSYLIKDHIFCILLSINFMNILPFCRFRNCVKQTAVQRFAWSARDCPQSILIVPISFLLKSSLSRLFVIL